MLESCLLGVPVGALCICNLVISNGAVSAVFWLGWGVGICGVPLSHSMKLRCTVVLLCSTI